MFCVLVETSFLAFYRNLVDFENLKKGYEMNIVNTPYDDVFRTLLNDCSSLIIPVINEVFSEHYTGKEEIIFLVFWSHNMCLHTGMLFDFESSSTKKNC